MRIRKRQVPLPLSSLSPVPVSDPHFNRSPVVQLQCKPDPHQNLTQGLDATPHFNPQPSDQPNQPIGGSNGLDSPPDDASRGVAQTQKKINCLVLLQDEDYEGGKREREGEEEEEEQQQQQQEKSCNDTRKRNILGAETALNGLPSSHQVVGRWCEGEKAFPLKKRRGSFERRANDESALMEEEEEEEEEEEKDSNIKKMKTKMKTKMNKKFAIDHQNDSTGFEQPEASKEMITKESSLDNNSSTTGAKKRARGGALMEGSRCSRVNGRGWRCCQQTLVGYSLCEHHLGKGRLRSMTSVRSRSLGSTKKNETQPLSTSPATTSTSPPISLQETKPKGVCLSSDADEVEEDEKPLMITKKRMKLGTVKARSISSLLGQTNNEIFTVADNNR